MAEPTRGISATVGTQPQNNALSESQHAKQVLSEGPRLMTWNLGNTLATIFTLGGFYLFKTWGNTTYQKDFKAMQQSMPTAHKEALATALEDTSISGSRWQKALNAAKELFPESLFRHEQRAIVALAIVSKNSPLSELPQYLKNPSAEGYAGLRTMETSTPLQKEAHGHIENRLPSPLTNDSKGYARVAWKLIPEGGDRADQVAIYLVDHPEHFEFAKSIVDNPEQAKSARLPADLQEAQTEKPAEDLRLAFFQIRGGRGASQSSRYQNTPDLSPEDCSILGDISNIDILTNDELSTYIELFKQLDADTRRTEKNFNTVPNFIKAHLQAKRAAGGGHQQIIPLTQFYLQFPLADSNFRLAIEEMRANIPAEHKEALATAFADKSISGSKWQEALNAAKELFPEGIRGEERAIVALAIVSQESPLSELPQYLKKPSMARLEQIIGGVDTHTSTGSEKLQADAKLHIQGRLPLTATPISEYETEYEHIQVAWKLIPEGGGRAQQVAHYLSEHPEQYEFAKSITNSTTVRDHKEFPDELKEIQTEKRAEDLRLGLLQMCGGRSEGHSSRYNIPDLDNDVCITLGEIPNIDTLSDEELNAFVTKFKAMNNTERANSKNLNTIPNFLKANNEALRKARFAWRPDSN